MSARLRPTSTLPKPPTTLAPTAVIADTAVLTGSHRITIQASAVIHPRARLVTTNGAMSIGEGCIISERAIVGAMPAEGSNILPTKEGEGPREVLLGSDVLLEPAAVVEVGSTVGEGSTLEAGSRVCAGAELGKVSSA